MTGEQGITYFEVLEVSEVPDHALPANMGAKYSVYVWQFKKYDDGRVRTRWATSEGLDEELNRLRFSESSGLKNDGWHDTNGRNPAYAAGFQYFVEFGGVLETGKYLETKDEFDKK